MNENLHYIYHMGFPLHTLAYVQREGEGGREEGKPMLTRVACTICRITYSISTGAIVMVQKLSMGIILHGKMVK